MDRQLNVANYEIPPATSLVQQTTPQEGQSVLVLTQQQIDSQTYPQSTRNLRNAYIIPIEKQALYLNFIAEKTFVGDNAITSLVDNSFSYFTVPEIPVQEPFLLPSGVIFRCVGEGVKDTQSYTYYLMQGSTAQRIPNWKTVEVLMKERGITSNEIRILEQDQCSEIVVVGVDVQDQSSNWTPAMQDLSTMEQLAQAQSAAQSAQAIVAEAQASTQQQVDAVLAQAAADKQAAEAAQAEANAAVAASAAAQAQAAAAAAASAAAQAEAEAAKAEAEAAKAEFEAQQGS